MAACMETVAVAHARKEITFTNSREKQNPGPTVSEKQRSISSRKATLRRQTYGTVSFVYAPPGRKIPVPFTTRQKGSGDENETPSPANGGMETSGYLVEHAPITASDPIKRWVDPPEKKEKTRAPRVCWCVRYVAHELCSENTGLRSTSRCPK